MQALRHSMLLAVASCLALSAPVMAESEKDEPTEEEMEQAAELFMQGQEAYKDGRYAQALVAFLDSYDIYPADELLYNIAFCYEKLDQPAKAVEYYKKYLDSLPEDEEKERAEIMARIEVIEGGEDEEEPELSKKEKFKKRVTGEYKGDWMHGLWAVVALDLMFENGGYYPNSDRAGLGVKAAYNVRLLDQNLALALELGYLVMGYTDDHAWSLVLDVSAGYRVGLWRGGSVQMYVGGAVDLKYFKTRTYIKYGTVGVGGFLRLFWMWGEKVGLLFELMPTLGISPRPITGYVYGYMAFKLGFVFGLK